MTGNLATLLFGTHRRDALALLLLHPEDALHVREIGRITGKAPGTILRELNRLADAGVIIRRPVGNQVQFQANAACPIYEDLRNILKKTAALADVLERGVLVTRSREDQRRPVHLEAAALSELTGWIDRYQRQAEERLGRLEAVLATLAPAPAPTTTENGESR